LFSYYTFMKYSDYCKVFPQEVLLKLNLNISFAHKLLSFTVAQRVFIKLFTSVVANITLAFDRNKLLL
jgi:hypothetical protein